MLHNRSLHKPQPLVDGSIEQIDQHLEDRDKAVDQRLTKLEQQATQDIIELEVECRAGCSYREASFSFCAYSLIPGKVAKYVY